MLGGFDGPYLFGNLAGIQNVGLAWDRVLIAPTPSGDLTGAEATVGTVRGDITVSWAMGGTVCGEGYEDVGISVQPAVLNCSDTGGTIDQILFANYGTTTGSCHNYTATCTGDDSRAAVEKACLGKGSCVVVAKKSAPRKAAPKKRPTVQRKAPKKAPKKDQFWGGEDSRVDCERGVFTDKCFAPR